MSHISHLKEEYTEWLQTLGYSAKTVKSFTLLINEMLVWHQQQGIHESEQLTAKSIETFFFQWKNRRNKTTGAGLSQQYANSAISAIHKFIKFLKATGKNTIELQLKREQPAPKLPQVLTKEEIQALYDVSYTIHKRVNTAAYGQRDRAMLTIFYGCGLRRNEGVNLLTSDILADRKMLFVRKGKGNKERFVPITNKGLEDIMEYMNYGRKWFLQQRHKKYKPKSDYFFINVEGLPMREFTQRIRALKEEAGINKEGNLHVFRHSIATHLLQEGMDIEQIKKFLGHSSLESTQIYTHIVNAL